MYLTLLNLIQKTTTQSTIYQPQRRGFFLTTSTIEKMMKQTVTIQETVRLSGAAVTDGEIWDVGIILISVKPLASSVSL